ncbi:MAG: hypothetical protein KAV00_11950 [Phycisphaerae bacterium]|nr:hypothetical protein [Phycisphaerae bacterium]
MQQKTIVVKCPRCGNEREILEVQAGRSVVCPACEAEFLTSELRKPKAKVPVAKERRSGLKRVAGAITHVREVHKQEKTERRRIEGGWVSKSAERRLGTGLIVYQLMAAGLGIIGVVMAVGGSLAAGFLGVVLACAAWLRGGLYRIEHTLKYWQPGDGGGEHD